MNKFLSTTALGLCLAMPTLADEARDEILVIGSLTPIAQSDLGSASSLLSEDDLRQRNSNFLADILRDLPGLNVNRTGPDGGLTQIRIRGAEANHTLTLIDGIEANDPVSGSEFNFANLNAYDIDRVEVLRGAQSALYGSDALAGVVYIQTPTPEAGLRGRFDASGGSFGTKEVGTAIEGGTDKVAARLSLHRFHSEGDNAAPQGNETDGYNSKTAHGKAVVNLSDTLSASFVGRATEAQAEGDTTDYMFGSPTQGLAIDDDQETHFQHFFAQAGLNHEDGPWLHQLTAGWTSTRTDFFQNGVTDSGSRGERIKLNGLTRYQFDAGDVTHSITGMAEYERLNFRYVSSNTLFGDPNQNRTSNQSALAGEYRAEVAQGTALSASIRHDFNDEFDDATTGRVAASYQVPSVPVRFHASWGTGVSDPSFFERFGFFPGQFVGNPDLEPETSRSLDGGVEVTLHDGKAIFDITWFDATLEDEIVTNFVPVDHDNDPSTPDQFHAQPANQAGKSERNGLEISLTLLPCDWLQLTGHYTWLDAEDPNGAEEIRRAEHRAGVNATAFLWQGLAVATLGLDYHGDAKDTDFSRFDPVTFAPLSVELDNYLLVSFNTQIAVTDRVTLELRGENLTDENYSEVFGFAGKGRAVHAGLTVTLGD